MLGTVQCLHAQALDPNMLQFVGIIDTICTENIVDKDYAPAPWEKEGFHAGMQMGNTVLFTRRADKAYDIPDDVDMYIRLKDCYGNLLSESHKDVYGTLASIAFTDVDFTALSLKCFVEQGGEYVFECGIPWLGIEHSKEITLVDEPTVRFQDMVQLKTGSDLNGRVLFNTGYPYDRSRLTGQEKAVWRLRYQAPNSKDSVDLDKGEMALTFDNSKQPRLAAIDTLKIFREKPALGQYFFEVKTDWEKEAIGDMCNRIAIFQVADTLRAKATIDKEQYMLGTDKQLVVNLSLDCGYPFIHTTAPDTIPTVRIRYQITANGKRVFSDSLKIADQYLAVEPLQRNDKLVMNFDNVADSLFKNANEMPIYVHVTVEYDGNLQYTADFKPLLLKSESTGISDRPFTNRKEPDSMLFDLQGRSAGSSPTGGIYIQGGKKVIIK
jgi:hypothetical protein